MHSPVVQARQNLFGPQCPYCQEPVLANHLYCRSCGASQIVPEFDRAFCPFCGHRVSKRQEFCHECYGHLLPEETTEQEIESSPCGHCYTSRIVGWVNRYKQTFLLVGGLILASLICLVFTKTTTVGTGFNQNQAEPPSPNVIVAKKTGARQSYFKKSPPSLPSPGTEPPQAQLTQMLNRIRKAQLNKDINLFLSSFSPNFPELEEKRQKVLRTWKLYDFITMNFEIQDIHKQDNKTVSAKIYWQIEFKKQNTTEIKQLDKYYCVSFAKEGDQWLIRDM